MTAAKPVRFFDPENGDLPDVIDLRLRRAPGFEHLSHAEYSKLLRDKVAEAEEKAATERREKGIKPLGRKGVLSQPWNAHPGTREPRRQLSPRIACKNTWARIEALQRNQDFIDQYREARDKPGWPQGHFSGRDLVAAPLRRREVRRDGRHRAAELTNGGFQLLCGVSPGLGPVFEVQT